VAGIGIFGEVAEGGEWGNSAVCVVKGIVKFNRKGFTVARRGAGDSLGNGRFFFSSSRFDFSNPVAFHQPNCFAAWGGRVYFVVATVGLRPQEVAVMA